MAVLSNVFSVPLGTQLPDVALPDLAGDIINLRDHANGGALLVVFGCNHCPYVRHIEHALGELVAEFAPSTLAVIAISSNDVGQYPDDDVAGLRAQRDRSGWDFPYLVDSDQSVAKSFNAACTPDFFLFDAAGSLQYRGAFDYSTPKNSEPVTGKLLRDAVRAVVKGETVPEPHKPAMGCGIKWKPGNEPDTIPS